MTLTDLADRVGMTLANLSILKTGKARAIRFSTLDAICEALSCQPGDILRFEPDADREQPVTCHERERQPMNHTAALTITSLLTILFSTFHLADDVVRGIEPGGTSNYAGILIMAVFLYATLMLGDRRWAHVIVLLPGRSAARRSRTCT